MQDIPTDAKICIRKGTDSPRWSGHTFQPVHSKVIQDMSHLKAPDKKYYKYWAYFCVSDGPGSQTADHFSTRLACTNDLYGKWEFFKDQEILRGRWPSVTYDVNSKIFYMFYGNSPQEFELMLATSTDGINWQVQGSPIISYNPPGITGGNNTFLWIDEVDKAFYLFYHDEVYYEFGGPKYYRIVYRKVSLTEKLEKMRDANGVIVLENENRLIAAPSVYRNKKGEIILLVETHDYVEALKRKAWRTEAYYTSSLKEGSTKGRVEITPIRATVSFIDDDDACTMAFYDNDKLYLFYAHQANISTDCWDIMMKRQI